MTGESGATATTEHGEDLDRLLQVYRAPVPTVREFVTSLFYLGHAVEPCPAQLDVLEAIFDPEHTVNEVGLHCGVGWGKTFLVATAISYIVYRTLCLRHPQAYYGLAPGTVITLINFSVTATQAHDVLFQEIATRIDASPAFRQEGFRRDTAVRSSLRWRDHGIIVRSGSSESRSAIGYNVLGAAIDEASWFPRTREARREAGEVAYEERDAARELGQTVRERMRSRGNERWRRDSLILAISSPRSKADWLEELGREAEAGKPHLLFRRMATWEGYPGTKLSGDTFADAVCGRVPVEYRLEFERNTERARRNLGAVPPERFGGFFTSAAPIWGMFNRDLANVFDASRLEVRADAKPCCDATRCAHVDLALRRDACGMAVAHVEDDTVIVDGLLRLTASDFPEGEIDLSRPRELLMELRDRGFHVVASYDGYQSADSMQQLRKAGIEAGYLSVDRGTEAYDTLKEVINSGRLRCPEFPLLGQELADLEYDAAKGKVDHGLGRSKDVADGLAGAVLKATELAGVGMPGIFSLAPE